MNRERLMKMASAVRTGGKGSVRRKKKAVHKGSAATDDKRLQGTLKRLGVNAIPGIEEVNIFKDDTVIHFSQPKVQASIAANTYVVSGACQTKKLQDLLPTIINQLGPDSLANLKKIAQQYQQQGAGAEAPSGAADAEDDDEEEDDDVPDLVENFEEAAKS
eukprot:jgi/Chlat1/4321/Chrsp29S04481